jgi:hypothetical protein
MHYLIKMEELLTNEAIFTEIFVALTARFDYIPKIKAYW